MKIERKKNSVRNTIWGVLDMVVRQIGPFLVRTVLIYQMSAAYAGLNTLFTSILTVLSLAELGFGSAISYSLYKPIAEDDTDKICALMNLYKKIYRIIGCVVLVIGLALVPALKYIVNTDVPQDVNIYVLYAIYLGNTVVSYFLFAYKNCLLSAHQRLYIISNIGTVLNCLMYISQILVLCTIKNYYVYIIFAPITSILNNVINAYFATKLYPNYKCRGTLDAESKKAITKQVIGIMFNRIGAVTRNSLDSIVLSSYLGLIAVTQYNNYFFIMNAVISILGVISTSIVAGVGNSIVVETVEKNYKDFKKFNFLYMWISGWCTVCLFCLYQPAIKLWLGDSFLYPISHVILFCFYFFLLKVGDINSVYYNAAGLWWYGKIRYIVEAILNLFFNIVMGYFFGAFGVILATIMTIIVFTYWYGSRLVFKYYFGVQYFGEFIKNNFFYLFVTVIACAVTFGICSFIPMEGTRVMQFGMFIVRGIICVIVPNIVLYLFYSRNANYEDAKSFMLNLVKKKLS